ncbi:MAG: long-chain fatty acid--CoA ligase [Bacteroidota bacterium]
MEVKRIFDLIPFIKEKYNNDICLAGKKGGKWITYSIDQYRENVDLACKGLLSLGIKKNDKIATISNNRPEWNFVDLAIMQIGAIHVPVYPTISGNELGYILKETEIKIIFISGSVLYNKVVNILNEISMEVKIYTFDNIAGAEHYNNLKEAGKQVDDETMEKCKSGVCPDDIATIIYTSGTTDLPKGVMLSHNNLVSNFIAASKTMNLNSGHVTLSYLPLCHVYERMLNYKYQYLGISVYYAENLASVVANFQEVKPTVLTSVPLLLEKIYDNILEKGSHLKGIKKSLFRFAIKLSDRYPLSRKFSFAYKVKLKAADLVFKKWREALGGKLGMIICGGAALQPRILKAFWAAGIPVYEGYGLTETSPLISNNNYGIFKLGTVGKILEGVNVKIAADGEILVKGPNVMLGYFKNQELTTKTVDADGWMHTGDIGVIEDDVFLKLTGRKKDIFKTSSGFYVSPERIEGILKQSPMIAQVLVAGANHNYLSALIVPDFKSLAAWSKINNVEINFQDQVINDSKIFAVFQCIFDEYNRDCRETERILKFRILSSEWTVEGGELTPKMSMKRNFITQKYHHLIEEFYSSSL